MQVSPGREGDQIRLVKRPGLSRRPAHQPLIVLANRSPVSYARTVNGEIVAARSASGLVTALEPLLATHSGTWVAHGSGDADRLAVNANNRIHVPSGRRGYQVRYVWLPEEEHHGYYWGFANGGLWPLCHDLDVAPVFRRRDFDAYEAATRKFVAAVVQESAGSHPVVLVQDYHFALAPRLLRDRLRASTIVTFWHIPWPAPDVFNGCPWARQLLEGLLGSSSLGFQTDQDRVNFIRCVEDRLDAQVNPRQGTITYHGNATSLRVCPVGVEWNSVVVRSTPPAGTCRERVYRELGLALDVRLGVGVDRLDYTKGIPQKFLAIERLLEEHPEVRGRFQFVQIAEPSRGLLPAYQQARRQVLETRDRVNGRFGGGRLEPVRLLEAHHEADAVYRLYRAADLCYVGSLRDGMNLVAKEFVSARADGRGVLVLSRSAGAAQQLRAALLVNPNDVGAAAHVLHRALSMPEHEQAARMRLLRSVARTYSAQWWAEQLLYPAHLQSTRASRIAAERMRTTVRVPA